MNQQPKQQRNQPSRVVSRQVVRPNPPRRRRRARRARNIATVAPVAMGRVVRMQNPTLQTAMRNNKAVTTIVHREFVADISGSTAFAVTQFQLNPGLALTFPWLAQLANNWDSYLFKSLRFHYETSSPTTTSGSVMVAIDFDAADPAPVSKAQLMTYEFAVRSSTWEENTYDAHQLNLEKFGVQRYTRSGNLAPNLDIKTYDIGNLFVATVGQSDTSVVGELYVDYVIELFTPQTNPVSEILGESAKVAGGGTLTTSQPLGTAPSYSGGLPLSLTGDTVTFNEPGQFLVAVYIAGSNLTTAPLSVTMGGGATNIALLPSFYLNATTSGTQYYAVNVPAAGGSFKFTTLGAWTITSTGVRIGTYAYSLS